MTTLASVLREAFGERVQQDAPLAPLTTFRVGGRADVLIQVHAADELVRLVQIVREAGAPLTILGGGSNTLIADTGLRGVVVRVHGGHVQRLNEELVRADSGVTINGLVRWLISRALGGLEMWAGTPGTVGGAVHGNAHFQGRLIGDRLAAVRLLAPSGEIADVPAGEMDFGYDYSRLHRTAEIVLSADFKVQPGDAAALRQAARASLAFRKRTQPLALSSAGCIFQNPDPSLDPVPPGIPPSAGALIDRAGLKGMQLGGAEVSTVHGNFIVNTGSASAADIRALIERCRATVQDRFGVTLREEVVCLGFEQPPLNEGEPRHDDAAD